MPSRQAAFQAAHRKAGLCINCNSESLVGALCIRCALVRAFSKKGILAAARKSPKSWDKFVVGMAARWARIQHDEGFAFSQTNADAEKMLKDVGFTWAKYKRKKQVIEIMARFDERAIQERMRRA